MGKDDPEEIILALKEEHHLSILHPTHDEIEGLLLSVGKRRHLLK
jgi:hypothetical protein